MNLRNAIGRPPLRAAAGGMHEIDAGLRGEIREAEARLRTEIAAVRTEIANSRTETANLRAALVRWTVGVGIAAVLAIGGMILSATLALLHAH